MAATFLQTMKSVQWTPAEVTYGAWDGFRAARTWEHLINYNSIETPKSPLGLLAAVNVGMGICLSFGRASNIFSLKSGLSQVQGNFFQNHKKAFLVGGMALAALNAIAVLRNQTNKKTSEVPSTMDKFLVVVWRSTPYLMMITNVALIIIDLRRNKVIGMVSLTAIGISLIDLTPWKPENFSWYLDVGARIPLDIATMFYNEQLRTQILITLALDSRIRALFRSYLQ